MSRQSLDDKKVFQNFFTKLLYNRPPVESFANLLARDWSKTRREPHELHLNYSKTVQEVLNSACGNLWQNVASSFFPDIQDPIEKWNNHCRFFLKGGKAQYNKMVALGKVASPNLPSGGDDLDGYEIFEEKIDPHMPGPNIAMVLADTLASSHKNSDFDFEFLINGGYDEEEVVERLDAAVAQCARTCENQLKDKLHDYIDALNDYENQKELRDNLRLVLPRLTGERNKKLHDSIQEYLDRKDSNNKPIQIPIPFRLNQRKIIYYAKPTRRIIDDSIYLFRIVLDIKTGIKAFDQGIFAMFAELIDVAYQVRNTEHIWAHSTLEFMQRPVPLVDVLHPTGIVMYPVANLSYLINDTLLIFYERQPSKVSSRCASFMRMLYLSCVEQKLAHLPREIKVSKEMWHNINTVADCKELQQLFSFVSADENGFVTLQTSPALQNIDSFEQWCVERKFPFTELAEFKMLPTTKIAGQLAKISREIFHDDISFTRSNKDGLILYLHQLQLLQQLCLCFLQSCKPQLLQNRFYEVDFTPASDANKQHVDEVLELMKSSLNSINPATSIFSLVQSNKILCQRNPFAALISKFRFIARD